MATKKTAAAEKPAESKSKGQGAAVILPNGERRIDYIRRRYYDDDAERGEIRNEINKMYEDAGEADKKIAYQIVFAATKDKDNDPRKASKEDGDGKAAAE